VHVDSDFTSFESVRGAAAKVLSIVGDGGLDVLCLNAEINYGTGDTKDSYDVVMQVNQIAQMLLLSELYPALEKAAAQRGEARVVFHTSMARMAVGEWRLDPQGILHVEFLEDLRLSACRIP
jgi:NAD(P)-dependent dehydrogenase (short-subunit alcohol dehydrogenase family)